MFSERSRYKDAPTVQVLLPDGRTVVALAFTQRKAPPLLGYHPRQHEQRLDHLANYYLKDPAGFWRLCDANVFQSPYALETQDLIAIPGAER
ncbi:MAG: hypothetical protein ACLGI6_06255 [Gammaproteobacteria bacterium]